MKKIIKKHKKLTFLFIYIIFPIILVAFWFFASLLFSNQTSFSVLDYAHQKGVIKKSPDGKILKGQKITGSFTAKENNLGIVKVRFNNFVQQDYDAEDVLAFKIKEKGRKSWLFENTYRSGVLQNGLLLAFGFPPIHNSFGKEYDFEIESLYGNGENSVEFISRSNTIFSSYQYDKASILRDSNSFTTFLWKKVKSSFTNRDFFLSSIIFILPAFYYVIFLSIIKFKKRLGEKNALVAVVLVLILFDIIFFKIEYLGIILGLMGLWIILIWFFKITAKSTFIITFILIYVWVFCVYFQIPLNFNKMNIWTFAFLLTGSTQLIFEDKVSRKK